MFAFIQRRGRSHRDNYYNVENLCISSRCQ